MTCEEFAEMLDNYESLTDEEKSEMIAHAASCEECKKELDFLLAIINQLNTLPKIRMPSDFGAKLNERLDLEASREGSLRAILNSVKRNYRQYSTIAACLVLAVVLGANGKTLLDRMSHDSGDTAVTVTDRPSGASGAADTAGTVSGAADGRAKTENEVPAPSYNSGVNIASSNPTEASEQVSKTTVRPIRNMSESINQIDLNSADKVSEPVYENSATEKTRIADENTGVAAISLEDEETDAKSKNYTIARGVYRLPDPEIARAELEASPDENMDLNIAEIDGRNGSTIARGRYYIPAGEEEYIAIDADNAIGVNSADAERAAELIKQYADVVDDSYYVINSGNLSTMLEHMDGEGISYQNNVGNADNEKVSFKLVIE